MLKEAGLKNQKDIARCQCVFDVGNDIYPTNARKLTKAEQSDNQAE